MLYKDRKVIKGMSSKRYPCVLWKDHPLAQQNGYVYVHQDVAMDKYGSYGHDMVVHHVDENVWNWSHDNIVLMTRSEHAAHHQKSATVEITCKTCGDVFETTEYKVNERNASFCSRRCASKAKIKTDWPEVTELMAMVKAHGYAHVGRTLGVSDNAVRKRISSRRCSAS